MVGSFRSSWLAVFFVLSFCPALPCDTVDPAVPFNGGALIFMFDGLEENRLYSLESGAAQKTKVRFRATAGQTVVLSGVGLKASGYVRWTLKSDGNIVRSDRIRISRRSYKKVRFNVDGKYSDPPPALAKRLQKESKAMLGVRQTCSTDCHYRGPVTLPVPAVAGWSNDFGKMRIINSVWTDAHTASDLTAKKGTPVAAFSAGRIALTGDFYYGGRTVMIDHGLGLVSMYCHLSEIFVKEGETIRAGGRLGLSGDTGCVTGPHLHFAVYVNAVAVNPVDLVSRMEIIFGSAGDAGSDPAREDD